MELTNYSKYIKRHFSDDILLTSANNIAVLWWSYNFETGENLETLPEFEISCVTGDKEHHFSTPTQKNRVSVNGIGCDELIDKTIPFKITKDTESVCFVVKSELNDDVVIPLSFVVKEINNPTQSDITIKIELNVKPVVVDNINSNITTTKRISDNNDTTMLLRTNPNLTGNVKLVVDSKDKIYFDTFGVSAVLSESKYRKQLINSESSYAYDIKNVYGDLPKGEMYKTNMVDEKDVSFPVTDMRDQHYTLFDYGAENNYDKLYAESKRIFAPIWIGENVPDFFIVLSKPLGNGSYNPTIPSNSTLLNELLVGSDIVKIYDMSSKSNIGRYIRNFIKNDRRRDVHTFNVAGMEDDFNSWYGISVSGGVVAFAGEPNVTLSNMRTDVVETPDVGNDIIHESGYSYVDISDYITNGFERHGLVSANIFNLEFMFDDVDGGVEDQYTFKQYYGLYVSTNDVFSIIYNVDGSTIQPAIKCVDGQVAWESFLKNKSTLSTNDVLAKREYSDRLCISRDKHNVSTRVKSSTDILSHYINESKFNSVYDVVTSDVAKQKTFNNIVQIEYKDVPIEGEHLRIINHRTLKVWEVYFINDSLGSDRVFDYPSYNEMVQTVNIGTETSPNLVEQIIGVKRICLNVKTNFGLVRDAFSQIDDGVFKVHCNDDNNVIVFELNNNEDPSDYVFQHITYPIDNTKEEDPSVHTININGSEETLELIESDNTSLYTPHNFELYGKRYHTIIKFVKYDWVYEISDTLYNILTEDLYYKCDADIGYYNYNHFINGNKKSLFVKGVDKGTIYVTTPTRAITTNNILSFFAPNTSTVSMCGIYPISVLDSDISDHIMKINGASSIPNNNVLNKMVVGDMISRTFKYNSVGGTSNDYYITVPGVYYISKGTGTLRDKNNNVVSYDGSRPDVNNQTPFFNTYWSPIHLTITSDTTITSENSKVLDLIDTNINKNAPVSKSRDSVLWDWMGMKKVLKNGISTIDNKEEYNLSKTLKRGLLTPSFVNWESTTLNYYNQRYIIPKIIKRVGGTQPKDVKVSPYSLEDAAVTGMEGTTLDMPAIRVYKGIGTTQNYVYYDMCDVVKLTTPTGVETLSLIECMHTRPDTDVFNIIINATPFVKNNVNVATTSYDKSTNILSFVFNGVEWKFTNSPSSYKYIDNVSDYHGYKACVICSDSHSVKPVDICINEIHKTILVVWYKKQSTLPIPQIESSKTSDGESNDDGTYIKDKETGTVIFNTYIPSRSTNLISNVVHKNVKSFRGFVDNINSSTVDFVIEDAPQFIPLTIDISTINKEISTRYKKRWGDIVSDLYMGGFITKTEERTGLTVTPNNRSGVVCGPFVQHNTNTSSGKSSVYASTSYQESNRSTINRVVDGDVSVLVDKPTTRFFANTTNNNIVEYNKAFTNFDQFNKQTLNNLIVYNTKLNGAKSIALCNNIVSFEVLKNVINKSETPFDLINFIVIKNTGDIISNYTQHPIGIKIDTERKSVGGYYDPKRTTLVDFYQSESDEMRNLFTSSFSGCNTHIRTVKGIPQLWENTTVKEITNKFMDNYKVVDEWGRDDVIHIPRELVSNKNWVSSVWETPVYTYRDESYTRFGVYGDRVPFTTKSFMGSVCFNAPKNVMVNVINKNVYKVSGNELTLSLESVLVDWISTNTNVGKNWDAEVMNDVKILFIRNMILPYFKMNDVEIKLTTILHSPSNKGAKRYPILMKDNDVPPDSVRSEGNVSSLMNFEYTERSTIYKLAIKPNTSYVLDILYKAEPTYDKTN